MQTQDLGNPTHGQWAPALIAVVLAFVGLCLSGYLSWLSLTGVSAAGCGAGSDCSEVLASRWAKVGPVPVALLGVLAYLGLLVGLVLRLRSFGQSRAGDALLALVAPLLLVAALWFTYVQRVEVGVFCPYCLLTHGVGCVCFGVIAYIRLARGMRVKLIGPVSVGVLAGLALVPLQLYATPDPAPQRAANPFANEDGDTWIDGARYVSLFGGELQFALQDVPYVGDPKAEQVVAVVFDYACPHCRTLHGLLNDAVEQAPARLVLVPIPLTIAEQHNPHLGSDNPRFEHSFELALLSMAVGAVDREKWQQFDAWLFNADGTGGFPADRTAARVKAEQLIGLSALNDQLTGDNLARHDATLKRNIDLLRLLPEDKRFIPVTTTPGAPEHLTTRYDDLDTLWQLLDSAKPLE